MHRSLSGGRAGGAHYLDRPGPAALAHRGGGAEVAENSRAALEHAEALGYRYVETDVHRTADGVVVLQHDPTLDRTTTGHGPLSALTWEQAARLRDHSGGRLVRLDEALADFPRLRLNIDLKEDGVVGPALRTIAEAGAGDRVCLASFSDRRLQVVRRVTQGRVATSLGRQETARLVAAATLGVPARGVPTPSGTTTDRAVCVQVPVRHRGITVVTPAFVDRAHRLGLEIHVWTIDDAPTMHRLLDLGVDGLVTDRPTVLRAVLRTRGDWDDDGRPTQPSDDV
ncbi:glycerophosphoryl diester phosphodiesterase [Georgenia satyanarayanai]|uniref:Glycerophosphoryl diester phosphodiesterase n=1 Tax=Georgenia satyanarayanai TaxID=860221 RepID=A0A2Y9ABJ1_9MICO|nr:glycerophosphodiester phosphodiesterase [Georgenia satyanarayanai]PYG00530.1 glycerophosphoryl diester phosphodiesterase [Georgenia satyanarayanai]SSA39919.1 glycerophosphoryl diester phosphodiesterase [Georgenia satyanarayanai]